MGARSFVPGSVRRGLPVSVTGAAYAGFGFDYFFDLGSPLLIDYLVVLMFELLAVSIIAGGFTLAQRDGTVEDGFWVFGATVGFGFLGFVMAAALIVHQIRRGVAILDPWFLMVAASVTTSAIGVGLALYYMDLKAEREHLMAQSETVSALNKQLTVLQRVLRHNLRNELTIIRGHAEMLLGRAPDARIDDSIRTLLEHTGNIESLSQNAYRLRQVWTEDAIVELELSELVESVVSELSAEYPGATITTAGLEEASAAVHPRFELAVAEAVRNAVEHNDREAPEVTLAVGRPGEPKGTVEITVADNGRGIPPSEREVLQQVEERALSHATGLGLWLIYWLVEKSDGELSFEPNEPHGTVVRMELPAAER